MWMHVAAIAAEAMVASLEGASATVVAVQAAGQQTQ
jgi:hypothetical protein